MYGALATHTESTRAARFAELKTVRTCFEIKCMHTTYRNLARGASYKTRSICISNYTGNYIEISWKNTEASRAYGAPVECKLYAQSSGVTAMQRVTTGRGTAVPLQA